MNEENPTLPGKHPAAKVSDTRAAQFYFIVASSETPPAILHRFQRYQTGPFGGFIGVENSTIAMLPSSSSWATTAGTGPAEHVEVAPTRKQTLSARRSKARIMTHPRKRAVTACESCRQRKIKCNNERPVCSACESLGAECSYDLRNDHSSFDPASLLILQKLNEVLQKLDGGFPETAHTPLRESLSCNTELVSPNIELGGKAPQPQQHEKDGPAFDDSQVPSSFSSVDSILSWPIFESRFPHGYLLDDLYIQDYTSPQWPRDGQNITPLGVKVRGIREEEVPGLIDRFLRFVHIKNPILEIKPLLEDARRIAENGIEWDARSCLVLLACALGAISEPFDLDSSHVLLQERASTEEGANVRVIAECYYHSAMKRLGLLSCSLIACQCHLLSGIYLMYTIRPLPAWFAFHQAASMYFVYLKADEALQRRKGCQDQDAVPVKRRLEQRLYWTCLKSECEMRTQLDLPLSELGRLGYPYLFPSPPDPSSPREHPRNLDDAPAWSPETINRQRSTSQSSAYFLKAEEQSWFYYLSEIALRRIENRVLNAFYKEDNLSWARMDIYNAVAIARDFDSELQNWQASLPKAIQFENLAPDQTMDELRFMTQARHLGIKSLLYRPFLYVAIHTRDLSPQVGNLIEPFVLGALDNISYWSEWKVNAFRHRHHGTWLVTRACTTQGLLLLAAKKSGLISWHGGFGSSVDFGRALRIRIETLKYWESESLDIARAREVLEALRDEIEAQTQDQITPSSFGR